MGEDVRQALDLAARAPASVLNLEREHPDPLRDLLDAPALGSCHGGRHFTDHQLAAGVLELPLWNRHDETVPRSGGTSTGDEHVRTLDEDPRGIPWSRAVGLEALDSQQD